MASSRPKRPFRVFLDASVLFAGALSARGYSRDLIVLGASHRVEVVASATVLAEARRNLAIKVPRGLPLIDVFERSMIMLTAEPPDELVRRVAEIVVTKDAPIVAGAMTAHADFLATFDRKHLLRQAAVIQERFGVVVATPEEIVAAI
ncbi:MAG: PIN domain-containing protein [Thermomicrobiales bacterium]